MSGPFWAFLEEVQLLSPITAASAKKVKVYISFMAIEFNNFQFEVATFALLTERL